MPQNKATHLSLKTLHLVSESLVRDFDQKMKAAVADVQQRVSLSAARDVTLKVIIKPHPEDADDVSLTFEVGSKTPSRKHEAIRCMVNPKNHQLRFEFADEEDE